MTDNNQTPPTPAPLFAVPTPVAIGAAKIPALEAAEAEAHAEETKEAKTESKAKPEEPPTLEAEAKPVSAEPKAKNTLPQWAEECRRIFRSASISQFLLHGNVFDLVPYRSATGMKFAPLKQFLSDVLFAPFEVVLLLSPGAGVRALRGSEHMTAYQQMRISWAATGTDPNRSVRESLPSFEFADAFLRYCRERTKTEDNKVVLAPLRCAVIIDFVEYLVPMCEPAQQSDRSINTMIRLLDWASDPALLHAQQAVVMISENASSLNRPLVENAYCAKLAIGLPTPEESQDYLDSLRIEMPELDKLCEIPTAAMSQRLAGLTRVHVRHMLSLAVRNNIPITARYLGQAKKELLEKECAGLLEFVDSHKSLNDVAGMDAIKTWLRKDNTLLQQGNLAAMPMGYLFTGRIGTGKTWLAHCLAGELGIPFVILKNFRDKWMGATEGNLEKIFVVLKALGQVLVFVDEADQMTGKRGGGGDDSGIGGRIYGMLAKEMSDTANRGKIIWVFATSRPDLIEVDLKRPGRLDVHIPLFPPQTVEEKQALFLSMGGKVGLPLTVADLPDIPAQLELGGNEVETLVVRTLRLRGADNTGSLRDTLQAVLESYRPSAHHAMLEFMDLIATRECTDQTFLPAKFQGIDQSMLETRINQLQSELNLR